MQRPNINEYKPYFQGYVDLTTNEAFMPQLKQNTADTVRYFSQLPTAKHDYSYEQGKWTPKQVLLHIIDTERVFAYRALVAARGDSETPLQKMDPDLYVKGSDVSNRTMESLVKEFEAVRAATEIFFQYLSGEHSERVGNNIEHIITPRALGYIMIGHIKHHMTIIDARYL